MDRVGCAAHYWLLCILYVIGLLNVLSNSKGFIPLTVVTGTETDVSPYLDFYFWQEVSVEVPGEVNSWHAGADPPTNKVIS